MAELVQGAGLTGIVLIDIAIGIIFATLLFSLIATALNETIAGVLNFRGEHLRRGIFRMINQTDVANAVMKHPLIHGLKGPRNPVQVVWHLITGVVLGQRETARMPSSVPKATFARALVEALVTRREDLGATIGATAETAVAALGREIDKLALDQRLKRRLLTVVTRIDFQRLEDSLGDRVDAAADRAQTLARALGVEIDRLGLDDALADRVKEQIRGVALSERADVLQGQVLSALDGLDLEQTLRAHVRDTLATIDFTRIEARAQGAIDRTERALEDAIEAVEHELAEWFDTAMDRVTGWYVRRAKTMLFLIGFLMAMTMNFDLIGYGKQLAADDALRSAIVQRAQAAAATGQIGSFTLDAPRIAEIAETAEGNDPQQWTEEQKTAKRALSYFDSNNDGVIDAQERIRADETLHAALAAVGDQAKDAITTVTTELGDQGVTLGAPFWAAPTMDKLRMVLSWFLIALGCTLGGQFWFDLLKSLLKVRAGASGLNSDIEKLSRRLGSAER